MILSETNLYSSGDDPKVGLLELVHHGIKRSQNYFLPSLCVLSNFLQWVSGEAPRAYGWKPMDGSLSNGGKKRENRTVLGLVDECQV